MRTFENFTTGIIGIIISIIICTSPRVLAETKSENLITYDKHLRNYKYPFAVKKYKFFSQSKSLEMAYMYLMPNKPEKGIVTLLHGKNFNGAYWKETANFLYARGYGVLIPDQIGFGKSKKPVDYQYSFEALAHNTRRLLRQLNIEKTMIVGHSMGGMLASRFALLYPSITSHLTLLNPIGLENYLLYSEYKDIDFFYKKELKLTAEDVKKYQKTNYYAGRWNSKYEELITPLVGLINGPDWEELAQISARAYDMIFTGPVIEEFNNFRMPVTMILGTRDRTAPGRGWMKQGIKYELGRYDQLGAKIKKRNTNIKVVELSGLGHLPHVEDFDKFSKILQDEFDEVKN
jgi:pimeloyl-ACP methyl ester carboxylesterase